MTVAGASLLFVASCNRSKPAPSPIASVAVWTGGFVGNDACRECHPKEFREHAASEHGMTLRIPDRSGMGDQFPPTGRIPKTPFTVGESNGRLLLTTGGNQPLKEMPDVIFGAGRTGLTFATFEGKNAIRRLRMSWFPSEKRWRVGPGMENSDDLSGTRFEGRPARGCVMCHAVWLPSDSIVPERRFMGVGCESCHGPGEAHAAAARHTVMPKNADRSILKIDRMGQWNALLVNETCGNCHAADEGDKDTIAETGMLRFQVDSIMKSRCFVQSLGKLSCVACHKPHESLSRDSRGYEAVCLKCHDGSSSKASSQDEFVHRTCPVRPRDGCIACHMPKRRLFPNSQVPTRMTDHELRARP